jgi:hypothetical protein
MRAEADAVPCSVAHDSRVSCSVFVGIFASVTPHCHVASPHDVESLIIPGCVQALFRKVAGALPGMDSGPAVATENMVSVDLASTQQADAAASACSC